MDQLVKKSIEILLTHQEETGAFYACPNFNTYHYCWFRDGSFSAVALSKFGYPKQAEKFFQWGAGVVLRYQQKIKKCIEIANNGRDLVASECFHSRFTVEGTEVPGNWGHNQLDGLGTWLWALAEFRRDHFSLPLSDEIIQAASLVKDYLVALWKYPCSDCWEENEDKLHTYTLAAISAGLRAYSDLFSDPDAADSAEQVKRFILMNCVREGAFVKSIPSNIKGSKLLPGVDANLVALCEPYGIVDWKDELFQKTLKKIESELLTPGLHRYRGDTYYGSGEWVLLTDWLGWAYARNGQTEKARKLLEWTHQQASAEGYLPEQVPHALFAPAGYPEWVERWGPIATPLLWSHAKYLLLVKSVEEGA
jgi:GH15 family glucan-1,4-alpha-glucosidase